MSNRSVLAAVTAAPIGLLGGLIGLGGAEFRLPLLKGLFRYPTHRAVALNLAVSLVTVIASLCMRLNLAALEPLREILVSMVIGSMTGAYLGSALARRLSAQRLDALILLLLVGIGMALIVESFVPSEAAGISRLRIPTALVLGLFIGTVASLLGVAGGELLIPTFLFVFGVDVKLAGTAALVVSLSMVAVGCWRYAALIRGDLKGLVVPMGGGSIAGAILGGLLLPYAPGRALKLLLGLILIVSAVRIFRGARSRKP